MNFEGLTVACLASGPSMRAEDCALVERAGMPAIAVNSTWEIARFADVLYAGDLAWWDEHIHKVDILAERWTCTRQAAQKHCLNLHSAHGAYNSGMRAIQFAIEQGAERVLLLGYDCSVENGKHWHADHAGKNPDQNRCRQWQGQFALVAKIADKRGVEVLNCSRETALEVFPRGRLEEALC